MGGLVIKKSAGGGIHIDEGKYEAVIEAINLNKGADGNEYFAWDFKVSGATIDDEPIKGDVRVRGFANALLTPKSKLTKWAKGAGIDVENEEEEEVDLQDAIGSSVRINVEDYETKDGATVSRVMKVSPSKGGKKKPKRDEDDEDDDERPAKKEKKAPKEEKKGKKKPKPVDDDDEEESAEEDEEEEEEEEEKKPGKKDKGEKKGKKDKGEKKGKKKSKDDESDDDDEDLYDFDDDEDADDDDD